MIDFNQLGSLFNIYNKGEQIFLTCVSSAQTEGTELEIQFGLGNFLQSGVIHRQEIDITPSKKVILKLVNQTIKKIQHIISVKKFQLYQLRQQNLQRTPSQQLSSKGGCSHSVTSYQPYFYKSTLNSVSSSKTKPEEFNLIDNIIDENQSNEQLNLLIQSYTDLQDYLQFPEDFKANQSVIILNPFKIDFKQLQVIGRYNNNYKQHALIDVIIDFQQSELLISDFNINGLNKAYTLFMEPDSSYEWATINLCEQGFQKFYQDNSAYFICAAPFEKERKIIIDLSQIKADKYVVNFITSNQSNQIAGNIKILLNLNNSVKLYKIYFNKSINFIDILCNGVANQNCLIKLNIPNYNISKNMKCYSVSYHGLTTIPYEYQVLEEKILQTLMSFQKLSIQQLLPFSQSQLLLDMIF